MLTSKTPRTAVAKLSKSDLQALDRAALDHWYAAKDAERKRAAVLNLSPLQRPRGVILAELAERKALDLENHFVSLWFVVSGLVPDGDFMDAWDTESMPTPLVLRGRTYSVEYGPAGDWYGGPDGQPRLVVTAIA